MCGPLLPCILEAHHGLSLVEEHDAPLINVWWSSIMTKNLLCFITADGHDMYSDSRMSSAVGFRNPCSHHLALST